MITIVGALWRLAFGCLIFAVGFGAGRNFSDESSMILVIPLSVAVLAAVASAAANEARRSTK